MKLRSLDDYYYWACDWCDSENRTLWVKVASGDFRCGACHKQVEIQEAGIPKQHGSVMAGLYI